jgi:hypothetical protein
VWTSAVTVRYFIATIWTILSTITPRRLSNAQTHVTLVVVLWTSAINFIREVTAVVDVVADSILVNTAAILADKLKGAANVFTVGQFIAVIWTIFVAITPR